MKKIILTSILAVVLACSCQPLRISQLYEVDENSGQLPFLEPKVDVVSFSGFRNLQTIPDYDSDEQVVQANAYYGRVIEQTIFDQQVSDAISMFEKEANSLTSNSSGKPYGYITCTRGMYRKSASVLHPVVSGVTVFLVNFLGFPFMVQHYEMELIVKVYNSSDELIGKYSSFGAGKATVAMYWGYTSPDAFRVAYSDAFRNAMAEIKKKMNRDYVVLNKSLLAEGPI